MNVKHCNEVKNPGDWAFFRESSTGDQMVKIMLPIPPVEMPYETAGDVRVLALPLNAGGWTWDGNEDAPFLSPSIKTEVTVGWTEDNPPKPIMREIYHGHLEHGKWRTA